MVREGLKFGADLWEALLNFIDFFQSGLQGLLVPAVIWKAKNYKKLSKVFSCEVDL